MLVPPALDHVWSTQRNQQKDPRSLTEFLHSPVTIGLPTAKAHPGQAGGCWPHCGWFARLCAEPSAVTLNPDVSTLTQTGIASADAGRPGPLQPASAAMTA